MGCFMKKNAFFQLMRLIVYRKLFLIAVVGAIFTVEAARVHLHGAITHAHAREASIVIEVLHGHLACEITEDGDTVIGTFFGCGISQRRHAVGEIHQTFYAFYAAACGGARW